MDIFKKKEKKPPKELKKNRVVILAVLGVTLIVIGSVSFYRDGEKILRKVFGTKTIVSIDVPENRLRPTPTPKFIKEMAEIESLVENLKGDYGVFVQDLATGEGYGFNTEKIFTAASLIKLPVLLTLYKEAEAGNLDLDTKYALKVGDKRGGAGSLQYKPVGYVTTYRKMAELMGEQSDNTAFNVLSKILSEEKIQKIIDDLGMKRTSFADGETMPGDICLFFYKLYTQNILVKDDRDEILSFLTNTIWEDRIPAGIPKEIKVAHKIGTEVGVISDAGIVFSQKPFILVILSEGVLEKEAKEVLPKIAEIVYRQRAE